MNDNKFIPVSINLETFLKLMGWGRTKFYETKEDDANLKAIIFQEGGPRAKITFWLHEAIDYKNRSRLVKINRG